MVLHQLPEGGPLGRNGVPALPHDHVPGERWRGQVTKVKTANQHVCLYMDVQLVGAVGRLVHAVALLQQFEEFFHWDARVGRATQREDLPQQHAVRPAASTHTHAHKQAQTHTRAG